MLRGQSRRTVGLASGSRGALGAGDARCARRLESKGEQWRGDSGGKREGEPMPVSLRAEPMSVSGAAQKGPWLGGGGARSELVVTSAGAG